MLSPDMDKFSCLGVNRVLVAGQSIFCYWQYYGNLKGPSHEKLFFYMICSLVHWSLCHRSFFQESFTFFKNQIFSKFLVIVSMWKVVTGKKKHIWKLVTGKKYCISNMVTGKKITSQIWSPKKNNFYFSSPWDSPWLPMIPAPGLRVWKQTNKHRK